MGLLTSTQQEYYDGSDYGNYQFISLDNIITQFEIAYVGEDKLISKIKRADIAFFAQRALQELSFDTFKSCKSQEIELPASLQMILPQDYVNYTKVSWVDSAGIKHPLYPTKHTSNPTIAAYQNSDGDFSLTAIGDLVSTSSDIVLDGEYKNIKVGMFIKGHYIPYGALVGATSNSSNITTITMHDLNGVGIFPTDGNAVISNTNTKLTFHNVNGNLVLKEKESHVVESLSWNTTDYKITASAAADITDIKIGMLVSHDNFPTDTTVTNVDDVTIVVSHLPDTAVTSGGEITFISSEIKDSTAWSNYKTTKPSENNNNDDYEDDIYWPINSRRYGLNPENAQINGSFYIDCNAGKIHFSSNISGKTVILDYISDSLGTPDEMQVHKFAEEAMYKWIAYGILSTRANTPEYIVNRFKKERFAETRKAKLRLSNIKLEEITQILRGKSKQIKH